MIKTVIFDLDGTLLDTLNDLKDSTNHALEKYGHPARSLEEIRGFVGSGVKRLIELAIPNGLENPDFENCLDDFKVHYKKNMYNTTAPYDGITEMLDELKKRGIQIGVVSNKFDAAVKELCEKYFSDKIAIAIGEALEKGIHKKPAPDSVFEAIKILGTKTENTVYVGDSQVDVQTAKNANIPCIGVTWGFRDRIVLEEEGADYIVDTPDEILRLTKEIR